MRDAVVGHHVVTQGLVMWLIHIYSLVFHLTIILSNDLIFIGYWALLVCDINSDFQTNK